MAGQSRIHFMVWICLLYNPLCPVFTDSQTQVWQTQVSAIKTPSPTETAHKRFEFDEVVHVVIQKPERPLCQGLRVGPAGPRRDQLKQVCELPCIYAVLLRVGPAGVVARGHGPGLLPVTTHHVFSLKTGERDRETAQHTYKPRRTWPLVTDCLVKFLCTEPATLQHKRKKITIINPTCKSVSLSPCSSLPTWVCNFDIFSFKCLMYVYIANIHNKIYHFNYF